MDNYFRVMTLLQKAQAQAGGAGWLYLRMFYSEMFFGYVSKHWLRYFSVSLALFVVLLAALIEMRRRSSCFEDTSPTWISVCFVAAAYVWDDARIYLLLSTLLHQVGHFITTSTRNRSLLAGLAELIILYDHEEFQTSAGSNS